MVEETANTMLGVAGIILAYVGIGIGLVCTGWATRSQHRVVPKFMMVAGFIFLGIGVFLRSYLSFM